MKLSKYHGAGNDFILIDNREHHIDITIERIKLLCHRHLGIGADGLMLLESGDQDCDFKMEYFNSDGSGGMMCGNGARCIVAFAADLGFKSFKFKASDGIHEGQIIEDNGINKIIKVKMKDVDDILKFNASDFFLDTGTRHYVKFINDTRDFIIDQRATDIRYDKRFAPIGTNVNIVLPQGDNLQVKTFEKGVEAETMACGTGIVASAIASLVYDNKSVNGEFRVPVQTAGGKFVVDVQIKDNSYVNIWLTGPTQHVAQIETYI